MPIAAVPKYLGADFKNASPGMRFGMYLKLWGINNRSRELIWTTHDFNYRVAGKDKIERQFKDENKVAALKDAQELTQRDKDHFASLLTRQSAAFATTLPCDALRIEAQSVAPFTTGLGNEHPLENGFAFLNPYGLPYLPGSGVKGVLRQAARELASGEWGEPHDWNEAKTIPLMQGEGDKRKPVLDKKNQPVRLSLLDILFGRETDDGDKEHLRGALTFWDVIPQIKGNSLAVEIMTPHQSHYYQKGENPHDSGSPNPISFLTIPPGSGFTFFITCNTELLTRHAPELAENQHWKTLLKAAFEHAFAWLGFGAKTAVGYGAMEIDETKEQERQQKQEKERAEREQQELKVKQQAEAQAESARKQAEFEALPEYEKHLTHFRESLQALQLPPPPLKEEQFAKLSEQVNKLIDKASHLGTDERNIIADAIEKTFEEFGWTPSGLKPDKRKKREEKRRNELAQLRINRLKGEA